MNEWSYTIITVLYGDYENILTEFIIIIIFILFIFFNLEGNYLRIIWKKINN